MSHRGNFSGPERFTHHSSLSHENDYSDMNEPSGSESGEVSAGGKEIVCGTSSLTLNDAPLIPHAHRGPQYEKDRLYEDLALEQAPPDELEINIKNLEKRADEQVVATFVEGQQVPNVIDSAIVLDVEVTFMAGADT